MLYSHMSRTPENSAVEQRLWAAQEREILRRANRFKEAEDQGGGDALLAAYKVQGYPKTLIRKVAGAARPATIEKYLDEYRRKIGLGPVSDDA